MKSPQFLIFGDGSWPVESFAKALPSQSEVAVWVDGRGWVAGIANDPKQNVKARFKFSPCKAVEDWNFSEDPDSQLVAIVGFQDADTSKKLFEKLRSKKSNLRILEVGASGSRVALSRKRRSVAWSDLISVSMDTEIHLLEIQERVRELRRIFKDSERIAILIQDDPDPDGLASALALRKVLGRNSQTAPIVSFGNITRPENVAMARLLEIEVETVTNDELNSFEKKILVDCQPSFFRDREIMADAIIDHHPNALTPEQKSKIDFCEIREDLGAVSTLLTQYLRATQDEISQRLATALLYGIKADTLLLNREVSAKDLEAFVYLYPRINGNTLRRIERPELPARYLELLRKSLENFKIFRKSRVGVLPMGAVEREEWIAQAADFSLQAEGVEWAFAIGVYDGKVTISVRNCGYVQHCGDSIKAMFSDIGSAGGHRTMAKAVIEVEAWEKKFGAKGFDPLQVTTLLKNLLTRVLADKA